MIRGLLQQALDALNTCNWDYDSEEESYKTFDEDLVNAAAAALEAELAKPEPVGKIPTLAEMKKLLNGEPIELAEPEQEFYPDWDMIKPFHERIKELEEQLAKPEQEPMKCTCGYSIGHPLVSSCSCKLRKEWVGLTDEEFKFIASKYVLTTKTGLGYFQEEIEAKLKEKNNGSI